MRLMPHSAARLLPGGAPSYARAVRRTALACIPALLALACAPTHHRASLYRFDPGAAAELEERAARECRARGEPAGHPTEPFRTDGCSLWPDGMFTGETWQACCVTHDIAYWCGGSCKDREHADEILRECVAANGPWGMGTVMYLGTRLGGPPWYPFSFRWAYGWDWPHGYDDLPVPETDGVTAGPSCHRR